MTAFRRALALLLLLPAATARSMGQEVSSERRTRARRFRLRTVLPRVRCALVLSAVLLSGCSLRPSGAEACPPIEHVANQLLVAVGLPEEAGPEAAQHLDATVVKVHHGGRLAAEGQVGAAGCFAVESDPGVPHEVGARLSYKSAVGDCEWRARTGLVPPPGLHLVQLELAPLGCTHADPVPPRPRLMP
ncbi:MAG TPA: hypothetical protein VFH47_07415 [Candidatus Thermoplasmatota archaeon]|nr:hypothetical protein [Candidatus Thermoplasmatota archaeon]